ncbi:MAG TPA: DUF5941 domain-containing protein [Streptosporangiaceae bacterium]|jgi:hypothetical protein
MAGSEPSGSDRADDQEGLAAAAGAALAAVPRRFTRWGTARALAPASMTGISVLLACCAAAWLSGGTRADSLRAVAALAGSYIAAWAAQLLAAAALPGRFSPAGQGGLASPGLASPGPGPGRASPGSAGPGRASSGSAALAAIRTAQPIISGTPARPEAPDLPGSAAAGMAGPVSPVSTVSAAGTVSPVSTVGPVSPVSLAGSRRLARLAGPAAEYALYGGLALGAQARHWTGAWELAAAVLIVGSAQQLIRACRGQAAGAARQPGPPPGADRLVLIAVITPVWGARTTLLALLCWAVAVTAITAASRRPRPARSPEVIARYRDDGRIARLLGQLVRGNLPALPGAVAGLVATAMVVALGMRNLPGLLVLTPVIAMLLAAPGASYRHAGRLDWLVPVILQVGQLLYLAALGFSYGVPAPLAFGLCAIIALHYVALSGPGDGQARPGSQPSLGWEGRMLVIGFGALAGVTMFAYAAMTAYLGLLICSKIMTICATEGASR